MKKLFLILGLLIFCTAGAVLSAEKYDEYFVVTFTHCLPTDRMFILHDEAGDKTVFYQIIGWDENYKCRYSEKVTQNEKSEAFTCNFVREQIDELVAAMKKDPEGTSAAKALWERYKNIPEVCTIQE